MNNEIREKFIPILLNVIHICVISYTLIGLAGYFAFGDSVKDLILFNMPS